MSHNPKPFGENTSCPICYGDVPSPENVGKYAGALSRFDNETEVCSSCGQMEALAPMCWDDIREQLMEAKKLNFWDGWKSTIVLAYVRGQGGA
tara:strand:- start:18766 stop:19044 length:279 start_codon:yes stop_codon:yes gene_type:complete